MVFTGRTVQPECSSMAENRSLGPVLSNIDPVQICSCYREENGDEDEDGRQHPSICATKLSRWAKTQIATITGWPWGPVLVCIIARGIRPIGTAGSLHPSGVDLA